MAVADPGAARQRAEEILGGDKFQEQRLPRPFKGLLEWLADLVRPVTDAVGRWLSRVFGPILDLPGGRFILLFLVLAASSGLIWWLASRRSRSAVASGTGHHLVGASADPAELERRADLAERDGDMATAVRLRFEAGLIRLVRSDRLDLRIDTTAEAAARQVADPTMDRLTIDFEEVTYGGRPARADDLERARSGWREVLASGRRS